MNIKDVKLYGEECLREKSIEIKEVTEEIKEDAKEMLEFVNQQRVFGLAYPQIGKNLKLFVVNSLLVPEEYSPIFVNPVLRSISPETVMFNESCLSFLGCMPIEVERYQTVKYTYQDLDGNDYEILAGPDLSFVLQHELDHLDGKLIIDRVSRLKKNMLINKFKKEKKYGKG